MTSTIKVNNIQNQCGQNIINESSNTITLGASGDTIALASGASQTGFGRTGTVDWQTTPKTSTFTAADGEGYFINSGSAITANLPAGSAGAIVAFSDYARNFNTYNFTIAANGSEKIGGEENDLTLSVNGQALTLVYVDSTKGWINIQNAEDTEAGPSDFIIATGGTIKTSGNFKTHIFTGSGTFSVSNAGNACGSNTVDYFVVAGGGSGGGYNDTNEGLGGGGAGGFRVSNSVGCVPAPTMSPLIAPAALPISQTDYPITIGGGATAICVAACNPAPGVSGSPSTFSTITSAGGGGGAPSPNGNGLAGGSGGGGYRGNSSTGTGGAGNTPPVSPSQGNNGGNGTPMPAQGPPAPVPTRNGGAGGGAGATGGNAGTPSSGTGGAGSFVADAFIGGCAPSYGSPGPVSSTRYFAGGGGGSGGSGGQPGGAGGGGHGRQGTSGNNGDANTGGGGGGANNTQGCAPTGSGGNGGSGIVMIRYKFQ